MLMSRSKEHSFDLRSAAIRTAGGFALAYSSIACGYAPDIQPGNLGNSAPVLREGLSKHSVEEKFGIQLLSEQENVLLYEEWADKNGKKISSIYPEGYVYTADWNLERMAVLERSLSELPKHLYQPFQDGQKIRFALNTAGVNNILCYAGDKGPEGCKIGLNLNSMYPMPSFETRKSTFLFITYALIRTRMNDINQEGMDTSSSWIEAVNQTFEGKFNDQAPIFYEKVKNQQSTNSTPQGKCFNPDEYDFRSNPQVAKARFLCDLERVFRNSGGPSYQREESLIPHLGEHYVQGKDFFYKVYSDFFGSEIANKLYNFVKENIFKGKEYTNLPIS